jgi:AcrR family transcriptional regulator
MTTARGSHRTGQRRRGRPANGDSAETRARLIRAARQCFADRGFDSTTVGDVARAADLVPSAFYHYFNGKEALYEAVYEETVAGLWASMDRRAAGHATLAEALTALVLDAIRVTAQLPHHSNFLVGLASEAARRPHFADLMAQRTELHRSTFRRLAALGLQTGELEGDLDEVSEQLRAVVVGWMTERHVSGTSSLVGLPGLLRLLHLEVPDRAVNPG